MKICMERQYEDMRWIMKVPKVCLGCFSEWEEENISCPYCGWNPEKTDSSAGQWRIGAVLEKRYLVGKIYCTYEDMAIWRIYDNLLGIPCFALLKLGNEVDALLPVAKDMQAADNGNRIIVLAVKRIGKKNVLLFSLKNHHMKVSHFQCFLKEKMVEGSKKVKTIEFFSKQEKRKQALPEGVCLKNRYRIIGCIGIGGFGITYLCEDKLLQRNVALKEYFPAEWAERDGEYVAVKQSNMMEAYRFGLQSFLKEIRISAQLIYTPHVVTVYDAFEANDTAYLVMKYISGISIGREMRARNYQPYSPKEMAEILLPVLEPLETMHEKCIIHSDVSPGNIIRSKQGDVCLIDMGASKYILESQTALSAAFLKIDYAAPEQYRTAKEGIPRDEGPWTDIYAVGATMYYLLTGHKPTDVISRLNGRNTDLVSPKKYRVKLSKKWMKLIHRAMALEKTERFRSIAELRDAMQNLLK